MALGRPGLEPCVPLEVTFRVVIDQWSRDHTWSQSKPGLKTKHVHLLLRLFFFTPPKHRNSYFYRRSTFAERFWAAEWICLTLLCLPQVPFIIWSPHHQFTAREHPHLLPLLPFPSLTAQVWVGKALEEFLFCTEGHQLGSSGPKAQPRYPLPGSGPAPVIQHGSLLLKEADQGGEGSKYIQDSVFDFCKTWQRRWVRQSSRSYLLRITSSRRLGELTLHSCDIRDSGEKMWLGKPAGRRGTTTTQRKCNTFIPHVA